VTDRNSDIDRTSFSRWAILLAAVLHVLLVWLWLNEELIWARLAEVEPPAVEIDLVQPPPALPPKPPAKPEPEHQQKPPEPSPQPKPEPEPKPQEAKSQPAQPPPPPQTPQLIPGKIAEHSAVPHPAAHSGASGTTTALAMRSGPGLSLEPKEQAKAGPQAAAGPLGPELTQSETDFLLSQIMKYWHVDFHAREAQGLTLEGVFYVLADGTLASPVNKNDPWNPSAVVDNYASLDRYRRDAVDGFILALKLSQPLQLPSTKGPWPRKIVIRFAFDKL
jgi:hypothetical protein